MVDLSGSVALVTGGGRGLGQAYAQALAAAGAAVGVVARTQAELVETERTIEEAGGQALAVRADVTDASSVDDSIAAIESRFGPIDILVNNAGINGPWKPTWETEPEEWWNTFNVNLRGPYLYTRAALERTMIPNQRGRIINISSAPQGGIPSVGAYSASKAALTTFTYCVAGEAKPYGVTVFAYMPGVVRTSMTEWDMTSPEVPEHLRRTFQAIFDGGRDDPIERSASQLVRIASGDLDALTGRYFSIRDDFDDLLRRVDEVGEKQLYMQRRVT